MALDGKVALITGAADGVGKGLAQEFLKNGAKGVCIVDINEEKGKQTQQSLQEEYGVDKVMFCRCDVTSNEQLEASFQRCKDQYGHIDVVCNNAGIFNEFKRELTLAVNLNAVIEGTYLAVKYMGTKNGGKGGVVVNTASEGGLIVCSYCPVYNASKHAVVGFTRSVAFEPDVLENEVRVVSICPSMVDTRMMSEDVPNNTRYSEEMKEFGENLCAGKLKVEQVASVAIQLIADNTMNGTASLIRYGKDSVNVPLPSLD